MLERLLRARRERLQAVQREAATLLTFLGDLAYTEARDRARACRHKRDRAGDKFWSKVAVDIASRTGREIGVKAADRYERSPSVRPAAEIRRNLQEIGRALASIAKGGSAETELHNIEARVLHTLDLVRGDPAARIAGEELCREASQLAAERNGNRDSLRGGVCPPLLETAGRAMDAFGQAAFRALGPTEEPEGLRGHDTNPSRAATPEANRPPSRSEGT